MELLKSLIIVSEKAAHIARACRQDEHLFKLLIEKKKSTEANPRFVEDFKTLADVLIQEMVKYDIKKQFPELADNIKGEENNVFTNILGEKICVEIKQSELDTSNLLETVLNGDQVAAQRLASEVHKIVPIEDIGVNIPDANFQIELEDLAIWIDPIDCTAEYINGGLGIKDNDIYLNGLQCVTILIGVFNKQTGTPVMGVVNRPFLGEAHTRLGQPLVWGVSIENYKYNNVSNVYRRRNLICLSSSECDKIKKKLENHGFRLVPAAGAGYKILTVVLGESDAYLLTKGTTFKWDTCAPHSILISLGGNIVDMQHTIEKDETLLKYDDDESNCNVNGIIVYRNRDILDEIIAILKQ